MRYDYRNTVFCPKLKEISHKKKNVENLIKTDHPKSIDMHQYLSRNNDKYKNEFIKAYNRKCAYCGVSSELVSRDNFEIDHFISKKYFSNKAKAGKIDNLVLACHLCNHRKGDFFIPSDKINNLHPDKCGITKCFKRDDEYYIRIAERFDDDTIKGFYEKLDLGSELRRLDYLFMNISGLLNQIRNNINFNNDLSDICWQLYKILSILRDRRSMCRL